MNRRDWLKATGPVALSLSCSIPGRSAVDRIESLSSLTEGVQPIPLPEYRARRERALEIMARERMQALFLEASPSLEYFTGIRWWRSERVFAWLLSVSGPSLFICPAFEEGRALEQPGVAESVLKVWEEDESPFDLAARALAEWGYGSGKLGVGPSTRLFVWQGLKEAVPTLELVDGDSVTTGCRLRKSPLELESLRLANLVTKQAYAAAFQELREGMTEQELGALISRAHEHLGAKGGAMVLFGQNSALPHGSLNERKLRPGDVVLVDGGCSVNGYQSDVTRSLVFGEPTARQREVWDLVFRAQTAACEMIRPGVSCEEVDRAARGVIEEGGFGPGFRYFTHRLGHGVGLEGHEAPYVVGGNRTLLEPGMVFSVEPGIYLPGEWGIRHEDVVAVTGQGAEILGGARSEMMAIEA